MIQRAYITEWRTKAPWPLDEQVEQDLIVSRALVNLYSEEELRREVAFRGGTALHKLFLQAPARYSEDIDLVQIEAGKIGPVMDAVRRALDSWLGEPQWKHCLCCMGFPTIVRSGNQGIFLPINRRWDYL